MILFDTRWMKNNKIWFEQTRYGLGWGASRSGSVKLPKWNKRKYFDHTFSCEKKDLLNNNNNNQIM